MPKQHYRPALRLPSLHRLSLTDSCVEPLAREFAEFADLDIALQHFRCHQLILAMITPGRVGCNQTARMMGGVPVPLYRSLTSPMGSAFETSFTCTSNTGHWRRAPEVCDELQAASNLCVFIGQTGTNDGYSELYAC